MSARRLPGARCPALAVFAVLTYAAVFGTAFALLVPPFEAPDEPAHLASIDFVAARAALPNQYGPQRPLTGHELSPTEGHQPPLYYAAAALLLRLTSQVPCMATPPTPNPLHAWNGRGGSRTDVTMFQQVDGALRRSVDSPCLLLLREFSVLLGVLNVAAVLALSRHFFAGHWRLLPAVSVATLPQFLFMSGVVNNDGLANLLITLCLLFVLRLLDHPERFVLYLRLGLLLGLALLAKKTSLFVLPGLALLAGYLAYRWRGDRRDRRDRGWLGRIAAFSAVTLGVAVLVCGWWFARNVVLYGDLLGSQMEKSTLAALVSEKSLRSEYFTGQFPGEFSQSLVGTFGWMQVELPKPVYWYYALLATLSAAGLRLWVRSSRVLAVKASFAALFVVSCFAGIVVYNLTYSQPQGRFLFPVLGLIAVFLTAGLRALLVSRPLARLVPAAVAGLVAGFVLVDGLSLVTLVRWYNRL
ncbi:MAG: DUF2142 domain-containing protein [Chloroflexi bacterium]|nr:DUF2142 domain-containing protein [Chloroflexota bacterium]